MSKKRDVILLVLEGTASAVTLYLALRVILGPDGVRTLRMSAARGTERFCHGQAVMWASLADKAEKVYDSSRAVTL